MNITKTNMLSLDNKIKKDGAVNAIEQAPALSKAHSNAGINALMFQGMQNLMANPMLAKKTGVMNDEPKAEETETAKSYIAPYSSNIAFQGTAAKTMKVAAISALMAMAAGLTTSCKEADKVTIYEKENVNNVTVNVDLTTISAQLAKMTELMEFMAEQNKLNNDQNQELMNQLAIWAAKADSKYTDLMELLKSMAGKIIDIDKGVQTTNKELGTNNAYQVLIVSLLQQQGMTQEQANNYLLQLINDVRNGKKTDEQAIAELFKKLDETNNKLDDINQQLSKLNKQFAEFCAKYNVDMADFKGAFADLYKLVNKMYVDGKDRTQIAQAINTKMSTLLADVEKIKATAIEIRDKINSGTPTVSIDYERFEAMFKMLDMDQQEAMSASTNTIVAKLNELIAKQEKIENAIKILDENNGERTKYIAYVIKNETHDNSDVIEAINNLAKSNEGNIAAAAEALAARLDVLNTKVDGVLGKMDGIAKLLQQYGDKIYNKLDVDNKAILDAIKDNGKELRNANGKLDLTNLTLAELKAEVEKIKPELVKLVGNTEDANEYLDIIANRELEIKQAIAELTAIAGDALTKDELEELWKAHDANAFAKAKAYLDGIHAEDLDKADEIIDYLKKGNKTAGDTYELLLDFANKQNLSAEELKKLLKAVYDYLPELICKCECSGDCGHNQQTHEGIIGVLD